MRTIPSHLLPRGDGTLPAVFRRQRSGPDPLNYLMQWTKRVHRWIPRHSLVMDIGCGIGIVARDLAHQRDNEISFILLDKTGDDPHVPVSAEGYRHNDLEITRRWTADLNAEVHDIDEYEWGSHQPQIVMSTLSWGFHYPLELYMKRVMALRPRLIIVDVREVVNMPGLRIEDKFHIWGKATTVVYRRRG